MDLTKDVIPGALNASKQANLFVQDELYNVVDLA